MTTSIVIDSKYKPRPDYAHYVENVYGGIDGKRTLKYDEGVDNHVCASCYVIDSAVKCSMCGNFICDACTPWSLEHWDIDIIEARCPVCVDAILYHDFY
jgi:hypothetical protein